jgi:hypothetical protein
MTDTPSSDPMEIDSLKRFWSLVFAVIQEFWRITEPHIEEAAIRNEIPIELYLYGELGLEYFSIANFQKRDPFTNPERFERSFARFDVKGWIAPVPDERYLVTEEARQGVRQIVLAGDEQLTDFQSIPMADLERLVRLLVKIKKENELASEPPQKWAVFKRFSVADEGSPLIVKIRETLMDLLAYHDDSYISAARPHFGQAGIVWSVLESVCNGEAGTAEQMSDVMPFRGYEVDDYEVAIQAAIEIGWVEAADISGMFYPTQKGLELRGQVEQLTDEYFFRPWSALTDGELAELHDLLMQLRDQLNLYQRSS